MSSHENKLTYDLCRGKVEGREGPGGRSHQWTGKEKRKRGGRQGENGKERDEEKGLMRQNI